MIEILIHGRGGRGGVTLAKLIGMQFFLLGNQVQSFGLYGAERAGAPVQAFVRISGSQITAYGPIVSPDHIIIIDAGMISPELIRGMKVGGTVVVNTPLDSWMLESVLPGSRVAVVDADQIAVANRLGTKAGPIVSTTMLGATARVLGLQLDDALAALEDVGFTGSNLDAARAGYNEVMIADLPGSIPVAAPLAALPTYSFLDSSVPTLPTAATGDWATRQPRSRALTAPCSNSCPAGNDVRGFLEAVARGEYSKALSIVLRTSPFPGVCGRVCPAPCMEACNRGLLDEAVSIREIERAVAEMGVLPPAVHPTHHERVAVVGGGPAGLSAAYHLARAGFRVVVFEAGERLGGLLRTGIPEYRLPRHVVDREIDYILSHDVEVHLGHSVDSEELAELTRIYDAVVVATGLQSASGLMIDGASGARVIAGLEFLDRAKRGLVSVAGGRVAVVGGGNTAIDAARTALRLGAESVRVLYRRRQEDMRAIDEEIEEALEEGVVIEALAVPECFSEATADSSLVCRRMTVVGSIDSDRCETAPAEGDGALFEVDCDLLVLAVGQTADLRVLPTGTIRTPGQQLLGQGEVPVVAAGDFAFQAGTVSQAIGSGREAAAEILARLLLRDSTSSDGDAVAGPDAVSLNRFPRSKQLKSEILPVKERKTSFREVHLGLVSKDADDVVALEAGRCLGCGSCTGCGICALNCPEGVMCVNEMRGLDIDYEFCKGCGICVSECPRGAIAMFAKEGTR